jgi:hypothetical protein
MTQHHAIEHPDLSPTWPHLWPLCWTATAYTPTETGSHDLTLLRDAVTCLDCIEWMHA